MLGTLSGLVMSDKEEEERQDRKEVAGTVEPMDNWLELGTIEIFPESIRSMSLLSCSDRLLLFSDRVHKRRSV